MLGCSAEPGALLPNPLPNGLEPFRDESLAGFVMRMAANHGFTSPLEFLKPTGEVSHNLGKVALLGAGPRNLDRYLCVSPDELEWLSPGTGAEHRVMGHPLHRDLVSVSGRKFCPLCLDDEPYHRVLWDLTLVTVCPMHAVRLQSHCHACGHALDWRVGPLTHCPSAACAADLRTAPTIRLPESEMAGMRAMSRLIKTGRCDEFGPEIGKLPVNEQIYLMFRLGLLAMDRRLMPRPANFVKGNLEAVHRVLHEGWLICSQWPAAFNDLLDRRRLRSQGRKGHYGVRKSFGDLYGCLEQRNEPFTKLLSAAFLDYILGCPEVMTRAPAVQRARSEAQLENRFITLVEAQELLGVGYKTVREVAERCGLYIVPPTGSGVPAVLRADLVHALHLELSQLLTKKDVQAALGTSKRNVDHLLKAGLLVGKVAPEDPRMVRIRGESVRTLIDRLEGKVVPATGSKPTVTIAAIAWRVCVPRMQIPDLVSAILDGKLVPSRLSPRARGLRRLLFTEQEAERFLSELKEVPGRTLNVVEVAERLGVKQEVAYHWVRIGLLPTTIVESEAETGRRITEAMLADFQREFVTGPEYALKHRLGRRWVAKHLEMAGVQQVSGPTVDGGRQYVFRRADLKAVDPERVVSGNSKLRSKATDLPAGERRARPAANGPLERALRRRFGDRLARHYNVFRNDDDGLLIQAMTARNSGTVGKYEFQVSTKQRADLAGVREGFLALAFLDRSDFLLVPWAEVEPLLPSLRSYQAPHGRVWRFNVRGSADGRLAPFGQFAKPLNDGVGSP